LTSDLEPELGLGTIEACDARSVTVRFDAGDTTRRYAAATAPLRRVRLNPGDRLVSRAGQTLVVLRVEERDGLLTYHGAGAGEAVPEGDLPDRLSFRTPLERLLAGRVQPSAVFDLRRELLAVRRAALGSPARGFVGGRVDLIPHQLYIASEVTRRHAPRVLLADEVGLGKTIEACLILHHLLVSGRIERALILVPESLLHQWLVELKRRFSLRFSLFDEARCRSIESGRPGDNPFLDDQLVLAGTQFLTRNRGRLQQAAASGWDLVVVDEAHHLRWEPRAASPAYAMVETLAARATGLLLLTATPEQLGLPGHFARLRLLDPARYSDLEHFLAETARYRDVARIADALREDRSLSREEEALLDAINARDSARFAATIRAAGHDPARRQALLDALIDQHGTGRIMFRNTRTAMPGFPHRSVALARLSPPEERGHLARLAAEVGPRGGDAPDLDRDPRLPWLAELLAGLGDGKVLLLCRSRATAAAIEATLRARTRIRTALFHEGIPLVQRDRNAAYFADPRGARLLLCFEIGSEGRNFQFAHHLVLFDLPLDPDLLEQRIGRLDRIGQTRTIHIHVPWVEGSAHEVLVAWHHRALDDLERCLRGGHRLFERFGARVRALAGAYRGTAAQTAELEALVAEVRSARQDLERELEQSRDHLLELSSFRPDEARRLVADIRSAEEEPHFPAVALRLLEHLGVYAEEIAPRTFRLNAEELKSSDFPELDSGDTVVTFDRQQALAREDLQFLTTDHPLFVRAADLLLGGDAGTTAFVRVEPGAGTLALEAIFLLECVAPGRLQVDRFLPTTPVRIVVDRELEDLTDRSPSPPAASILSDAPSGLIVERSGSYREILARLVERGSASAEGRARILREQALARARQTLGAEVERLRALQRVNPSVRNEEIALADQELDQVCAAIAGARLRLDAVRLFG
jgi:ATP-dependent helicase HepA